MEFHYDKDPNIDDYNDDMDKPFGSYSYKTASAIYNTQYVIADIYFLNTTQKTQILKELLKSSLKYPIFLSVTYRSRLHAVELKNIKDNRIVISNPWGQIET
jgi:ABC-type Fe3+ transport system substrate-binding protein